MKRIENLPAEFLGFLRADPFDPLQFIEAGRDGAGDGSQGGVVEDAIGGKLAELGHFQANDPQAFKSFGFIFR